MAATAEELSRAADALGRALRTSGPLPISFEIDRVLRDLEKVQGRAIDDLSRALRERAVRERMWRSRDRHER